MVQDRPGGLSVYRWRRHNPGSAPVVDLWLAQLGSGGGVCFGRGQCVEHDGESEPYLPVLEVLGSPWWHPGGERLGAVLRRQAPLWLIQLPAVMAEAEWETLQRRVQGATPMRMLRELADAGDVYAAETPLVMVLEDLHWSDTATVGCRASAATPGPGARVRARAPIARRRPVTAIPIRG